MQGQAASPDMRAKILAGAKKLFSTQGFNATTVRQICEEAGANVALVSYYFGGKENVFYALFDDFFPGSETIEQFEPLMNDPARALSELIKRVSLFRMSDPELINIMEQEILMRSPRMEYIQRRVLPIWQKLKEVLELGRKQEIFHFRSLDTTLMSVLGTMLFHKKKYYFSPLFSEGEQPPEDMIRDMTVFIFNALNAGGHIPEQKSRG
ncbi:TetR family transcriptional regulator [Paenibacillus thermotolerans]|uniref:TetR family transcriptional regulator n=1 Tax=Paenibacillus thermotolerans TaxID=3027807 RepID=UPI0023683B9A|nr:MULTISPECIES: TetR family transcriptional regulator [unclassified Paenibacillus]